MEMRTLQNYVNGAWVSSQASTWREVLNPATNQPLARLPLSTAAEASAAVEAAQEAFWSWRSTPPITRARYMFRLKDLLEENFEELAEICTQENGKTIDESRGDLRRAIENVDMACGIPSMLRGYNAQDVAESIDSVAIKQPLGVFVHLAPFNFPAMVPYWFIPYAIATGNTFVLKPSSQTPLTQIRIAELLEETGLPEGVFNLVNGSSELADTLMAHPAVKGVTFVGSTPVGKHVYAYAAEHGKRALVQGGAKNYIVVMPDANLDRTVAAIMTSACGCAGQRCLAGSVVLAVGDIYEELTKRLVAAAGRIKVGYGLDPATQMGPVISRKAKTKILGYIDKGVQEGAKLLLDGRNVQVPGYPDGNFVGPTVFGEVTPAMTIAREEIFGPVFGTTRVADMDEACEIIAASPFGNAASIFTTSGGAAREFAYRVECGNIGVNIGIAAPIAFFPFGGMKDSFFGTLHGQGDDVIDFFTDHKMVITRWF
jgi:malonate-semialdehyde dehydrogenase (acetylating) / methylmalonate-semialdehyde dehydrogenase